MSEPKTSTNEPELQPAPEGTAANGTETTASSSTATPVNPEADAVELAPETSTQGIPISGSDLQALLTKAAQADENREKYLRALADLDNLRKRAARERQEAVRLGNEALLGKLLPILDTFDMALAAAASPQGNSLEALRTGITLISSQLRAVLTEAGLEEIDATAKPFDPKFHEAISQQDSTEVPEGTVLQQLRKGYRYRERLLRPASVVVARKPDTTAASPCSAPEIEPAS